MPNTGGAIDIYFETHGDKSNSPLLLVNGFSNQLVSWHPELIAALVNRGFFVIVYDNRDVGLSTHFDGVKADISAVLAARKAGKPFEGMIPYTLTDMASDGISVLDALGIKAAHIAGMSMGGMIVQRMAIDFPARVLSVCSIMSHTGESAFGRSTEEANAGLMSMPPSDREGYIKHTVENTRIWATKYHFDADAEADRAARQFDRCFYPEGPSRQFVAIRTAAPRNEDLAKLQVPLLAIHGRHDTLITLSGGERTAEVTPDSRLLVLDGMGHDLPRPCWPAIIDAIYTNAERASV